MIKERLMRKVKVFYLTDWIHGTLVEVRFMHDRVWGRVQTPDGDWRWIPVEEVEDDEPGDSLPVQ